VSVTVVVPSAGNSPRLGRSVAELVAAAEATGPDAEVLLVVNGSAPNPTLSHVDTTRVRVLRLPEANVSRARNLGIARARHDTVLFGDDGVGYPPGWCVEFAAALADPALPVVTAPVRVPVRGPVTAFLDHQRVFDAAPLAGPERAGTVTGNCGLRRDRLPAGLRYDERNTPLVAEDIAFGYALRRAGVGIRWLAGAAPVWHELPERVEEITARMLRYGRGAARLWCRRGAPAPPPGDLLAFHRHLTSGGYRGYRRFGEVMLP
jgi:glycosyltransferase involved in cell wall biosynthesis